MLKLKYCSKLKKIAISITFPLVVAIVAKLASLVKSEQNMSTLLVFDCFWGHLLDHFRQIAVPMPSYLTEEEIEREKRLREEQLLSKVNWKNLSVYQREILSQRRLLLKYLNRLLHLFFVNR